MSRPSNRRIKGLRTLMGNLKRVGRKKSREGQNVASKRERFAIEIIKGLQARSKNEHRKAWLVE